MALRFYIVANETTKELATKEKEPTYKIIGKGKDLDGNYITYKSINFGSLAGACEGINKLYCKELDKLENKIQELEEFIKELNN
jgi:hypothetical protein